MAGKAVGQTGGTLTSPGGQMGQKLTRAYAEGRGQIPSGTNPHTASTPENVAWQAGYDNRANAAYAYETAVP